MPCLCQPVAVLSLSELMKEFGVYALVLRLETLDAFCKQLQLADLGIPAGLDEAFLGMLAEMFEGLKSPCESLFVDSTLIAQMAAFARGLRDGSVDRRAAVLMAQVKIILDGIHHNLEKRKFMVLSEEEAGFYTNFDVFGNTFKEKYPVRAAVDGLSAGNCYAAGVYTACVFHCMRVAEYGLRKLAANRNLRVKITKKNRPCPIEYSTWQEVIDAIHAKIRNIRQRPVGPTREAELQFFSSAADHCEYMKDIWRNEISHTRRFYKKEEALAVINRVKEFVTVIGDHKGSIPAEDSIQRLIAAAQNPPLSTIPTTASLPSGS